MRLEESDAAVSAGPAASAAAGMLLMMSARSLEARLRTRPVTVLATVPRPTELELLSEPMSDAYLLRE